MKRLLLSLVLLLLTTALLVFIILSQDNTDKCTEHKDFNGDLKCDICNEETLLNHTAHEDGNGDNKCDICGNEIEAADNPENNDTPTPPCDACIDENQDNLCDICYKTIEISEPPKEPCEVCVDVNKDGICDVCENEIEPSESPDGSELPNTPCETCVDENNDWVCDICYSKMQQPDYPVTSVTINGEDIKNHVIAYDSSHNENKLLAIKIQNLFLENLGLSLNILDYNELTDEKYIAIKSAERSGGDGFYIKIEDKNLEIISEFPNKTLAAGENYFSALFENPSETIALNEATENVRDIFYKDFGAIGNGIANDYEAIKKAHDYANLYGHHVVSEKRATYYIGNAPQSIIIRTNVNWSDSTFIIDDKNIDSSDSARTVSIFTVASDYEVKAFDEENEFIKSINHLGGLTSDTQRIDLKLGYPALLVIENSNRKNYIGYGEDKNSAPYQTETVIIDKDGFIDKDTPIVHDYTEVTRINAYRIDDAPIIISGGTFIRKINNEICKGSYYERNIQICRSNVTLEYIRYEIDSESENNYSTNPYKAFLNIENSNNVTVSNCTVMAHKLSYLQNQDSTVIPLESYMFSVSTSNNITWYNFIQSNFYSIDGITPDTERYGIISCEHSKNLACKNSTFSLFKANTGVYNISILSSTLSGIEVVGSGTLTVEDTYVYNNTLINLTEVYGSYWNGDIIIKNSFINFKSNPTVIGGTWYNHDFGYTTCMPRKITIDNLNALGATSISVFDSRFAEKSTLILKDSIDGEQNLNKMLPPESVTIKNNTAGYIFFMPDTEYFNNTIITED